jgi:2'-5' RNA ligase
MSGSTNNTDLFFVGIHTPKDVSEKVRSIQQVFADQFDSTRQLKIPVHITLLPPFRATEEKITEMKTVMARFSSTRSPFSIVLDGFGTFEDRVFFVDVILNDDLNDLFNDLKKFLLDESGWVCDYKRTKFKPHVTLANRDLSPENCQKARVYFKDRSFREQFDCRSIVLFRHVNGVWEIERELRFVEGY